MFDRFVAALGGLIGLDAVKEKLIRQPDKAIIHLTDVLEELSKVYTVLDSGITDYLSVWFDPGDPKTIAEYRRVLIGLEGGRVRAQAAAARGHCSRISSIYERLLSPWFGRVLDPVEQNDVENLFMGLRGADDDMLDDIDELSNWVEGRASGILEYVSHGNYAAANQEIEDDRRATRDDRRRLASSIDQLFSLQAQFINESNALGFTRD